MTTIDNAIAVLRGRDPTAYRAARAASYAANAEYDAQSMMIAALGSISYTTLERALVRALRPHTVEWHRYGKPSQSKVGLGDVNHADWVTGAHLAGEIWPSPKGGKFNMHMRVHLPFSLSPRDGDEFRRGVVLLKAAADAIREGGI